MVARQRPFLIEQRTGIRTAVCGDSRRDINLYVIICDQSVDRVLEDNINEKTNSSELAIDGRLLGEATDERSIAELLRDAMRDFQSKQDCPNEETLAKTWPALREQLREAVRGCGASSSSARVRGEETAERKLLDLSAIIFRLPLAKPQTINLPSWRRVRLAA